MNENTEKNKYCEECYITPVTDIFETQEGYSLTMEMPGVLKEDIEITLEENDLEVSGKVRREEAKGKELKYSEYELFDYYRRFRVGNDIDRDSVKADLNNGLLTLTLQKSEDVKPKRIQINA